MRTTLFVALFVANLLPLALTAQTSTVCATPPPPAPPAQPVSYGQYLPAITSSDHIYAMVIFIQFRGETFTDYLDRWPNAARPTMIESDFIDPSTTSPSGKKYNITTYFHDASFGKLTIIGHTYWSPTRYSMNQYRHPITLSAAAAVGHYEDAGVDYSGNVKYWATKHVLDDLYLAGIITQTDLVKFDRWTCRPGNHHSGPDSYADLVMAMWRGNGSYSETILDANGNPVTQSGIDNSFLAGTGRYEGFASLARLEVDVNNSGAGSLPSAITLGAGTLTPLNITMYSYEDPTSVHPAPGSGITVLDAQHYPDDLGTPIHEIGHKLGLSHQYNGGMWTIMGNHSVNVSYCANAVERAALGWINFLTPGTTPDTKMPDDGQTVTLRDFASTGDALSMHTGAGWFILENHQGLESPWITSLPSFSRPWGVPSDTRVYDVVDRSAGGAPGLYITRMKNGSLLPICADGAWDWAQVACPGGMFFAPSPIGQDLPVARYIDINRTAGKSDREFNGPWTNCNTSQTFTQPIWAYIDPRTFLRVVADRPKIYGDGTDGWSKEYNSVFSPYSNPSNRSMEDGVTTTNWAVEILSPPSTGTDVNIRFSANALDASPSKPQLLRVEPTYVDWTGSEYRVSRFALTWTSNLESDVDSYEIWRQVDDGSVSGWSLYDTRSASVSGSYYVDVDDPSQALTPHVLHFKVRAVDGDGNYSSFSDEDTVQVYFDGPGKKAIGGSDVSLPAMTVTPNPTAGSPTITLRSAAPAERLRLELVDALGTVVTTLYDGPVGDGRLDLKVREDLPAGWYMARGADEKGRSYGAGFMIVR